MIHSPRLRAGVLGIALEDGEVAIQTECDQVFLSGEAFPLLLPLLDGRRSADEIATALAGDLEPARTFFHLLQLEKAGLLDEADASDAPDQLFRRRLEGSVGRGASQPLAAPVPQGVVGSSRAVQPLQGPGPSPPLRPWLKGQDSALRVVVTSFDAVPAELVAEAVRRLPGVVVSTGQRTPGLGEDLRVAVTSDYLDPELTRLAEQCRREGVAWAPVKPQGLQAWIGPLLGAGEPACWTCLVARIRGLRVIGGSRPGEAPSGTWRQPTLGWNEASVAAAGAVLGTWLDRLRSGRADDLSSSSLLTLDFRTMALEHHAVPRRSACPDCGPTAGSELGERPRHTVVLGDAGEVVHREGGWRVRSAEQTLERLLPLVDPVTGVVSRLLHHPAPPAALGYCYRAWSAGPGREGGHGDARWTRPLACAGKGRTPVQAQVSALAEAVERHSALWQGGEPRRRASLRELISAGEETVHPAHLLQLSDEQYRTREAADQPSSTGRVPEPFDDGAVVDWTPAWSLGRGRWTWVASAHVYLAYPLAGGGRFITADTNGVAAGNCLAEAVVQGVLELVERDAVAIWWYNRLSRPGLALAPGDPLAGVTSALLGRGLETHLLDLTHDLGVPVVAAVAVPGGSGLEGPLLGFGAHPDRRIALERAVSELAQLVSAGGPAGRVRTDPATGEPLCRMAFLRAATDLAPTAVPAATGSGPATRVDLRREAQSLADTLLARGVDTLLVDLTRAETGLAVCRVLAPGLRHFRPRFGRGRLYDVPVEIGWRQRALSERELNPLPLLA
jgi:oxazoline/thiazoline synthase